MHREREESCRGWAGQLTAAVSERLSLRYERRVMLLLLLVLVVDYADRTLIGALGPTLQRVFHIGNTELGLLAAAFSAVGAVATIPLGMLVDRLKRTWLLALSLVVWAAAMGATGAAVSFAMLFGARLLLGAVSATTGPTTPSLTGDLVRAGKRAKALGFIDSGQLIGTGIGFLLAALVTSFLSFRWCFWLLGIGGAGLAVASWRTREPGRTRAAGPTRGHEQDEGEESDGQKSRVQELVQEKGVQPNPRAMLTEESPCQMSIWDAAVYVVRVRTDVVVLIARSIGDYFLAGVSIFGVVFATQQYHISQQGADLAVLVLGIGALAGVLLVGRGADILLRRGHLNSRIWLGTLGYLLAPLPLLPAILTHSLALAVPLFTLGAFFLAGAGPPLDAVRVDVIVPRLRGRAEAIRQVLRTAAEGGAPAIFGLLAAHLAGGGHSGLRLAFLVTLPVLLVSGLLLLIALRTYAPDVAAALASSERGAPRQGPGQATEQDGDGPAQGETQGDVTQ